MTKNRMELLEHLCQLHTTELGRKRIRENLELDASIDVVEWCKNMIETHKCSIIRNGKNYYVTKDYYQLTIHASSYTIITAHKLKEA